jgi:Ser/Thr protein kinase RdoA (MazF antagonist)
MNCRELVQYLLSAGLTQADELLAGTVEVRVLQHKNLCFHVATPRDAYLLKTPQLSGDPSARVEAELYMMFGRIAPRFARDRMPALRAYDAERSILVIEFIRDAVDLRSHNRRSGEAAVAVAVGIALGELHHPGLLAESGVTNADTRPWVLQILQPPVDVLYSESNGALELIRMVQRCEALTSLIGDLGRRWTCDAIIHHDMRLDNVLVRPSDPPGRPSEVTIIDWELCGPGWSYWDVACVLAGLVSDWVTVALQSTEVSRAVAAGHDGPEPQPTGKLIDHVQSFARATWRAYCQTCATDRATGDFSTVARLVGARLVQTAMEHCHGSPVPTKEAVQLLEVARMFARRPAEAWVHVLGLSLGRQQGQLLPDATS